MQSQLARDTARGCSRPDFQLPSGLLFIVHKNSERPFEEHIHLSDMRTYHYMSQVWSPFLRTFNTFIRFSLYRYVRMLFNPDTYINVLQLMFPAIHIWLQNYICFFPTSRPSYVNAFILSSVTKINYHYELFSLRSGIQKTFKILYCVHLSYKCIYFFF